MGEILLIIKTINRGRCPRFSPPPLRVKVLYDPNSEIAIMVGPSEKEVQISNKEAATRSKMEEIIARAIIDPTIEIKEITSPEALGRLKEIVDISRRIPEEPSLEAGFWGLIREKFDLIVAQG